MFEVFLFVLSCVGSGLRRKSYQLSVRFRSCPKCPPVSIYEQRITEWLHSHECEYCVECHLQNPECFVQLSMCSRRNKAWITIKNKKREIMKQEIGYRLDIPTFMYVSIVFKSFIIVLANGCNYKKKRLFCLMKQITVDCLPSWTPYKGRCRSDIEFLL
jgi:hypothetical protein